jgi:uncharacterized glyoxalase superfamily protein PhnB
MEKSAMANVDPIPPGHTTVTPCITLSDASAAIEFYKKAFGATERGRFAGPDGKIMHAEIQIGNAAVMLNDEVMGQKGPKAYGGSPASFYLYFEDADAAQKKAVAAGAKETMPVTDMFWGDRMGNVEDPFGFHWTIATRVREMTPEEIKEAGKDFMKQMAEAR